jgi:hypothetical protein
VSRLCRLVGLGAWATALVFALAFWSGQQAWSDGPRPLATPIEQIRLGDGPLRIAVLGDIQNGLSELADLLAETTRLQPDLILLLGDTVNNATPARYALLHSVFRDHAPAVPLLAVPGNHDMRRANDALDLYEAWIGPRQWRLDAGAACLLGLDNAKGPLSAPSRALVAGAAARPGQALIVAAHQPIEDPLEPRPDVQFAGHIHRSAEFVDARGTRHLHHGDNCDRGKSVGPENLPTVGMLTVADGRCDWTPHPVPRGLKLGLECRRLLVGSLYAPILAAPWLCGLGIAGLLALGFLCWRMGGRRAGR